MANVKHKLAEVTEFGEKLIKTEDLDPVYCALYRAGLPQKQLQRLMLAYFCFYHLGSAAFISEAEGETFWEIMMIAAQNKLCWPSEVNPDLKFNSWPRGSERRHFRGEKCVEAVKALYGDPNDPYPPEHFLWTLGAAVRGQPLKTVMGWIQQKPMFGPWIAFKIADILERVGGLQIEFPNDLTLFYEEPRKALDMLTVPAEEANFMLLKHFRKFKAPPRSDRPCNIQEVETICCKWKSSVGGHYWVGKDIKEVRHALHGWGETADKLLASMPQEVKRGLFVL